MRLTEEKAIAECKELWEEISASGLSKAGFLLSKAGKKWAKKRYGGVCPLCEHAESKRISIEENRCDYCLLVVKYGKTCFELGFTSYTRPSEKWMAAVRGL